MEWQKNGRKIMEAEGRNRKDWGLLYQNHQYQLGKGFCFNSFYCSYRFSHLKTYLNEDKLARQFNLPALFTKRGKMVDFPSLCNSQSQWKSWMTSLVQFPQLLEWVWNYILPFLRVSTSMTCGSVIGWVPCVDAMSHINVILLGI